MARPLFEQYKDALRRGHVALAGDELEAALVAYREASALVADRPLPYAKMAEVLLRLGRRADALEAYDRASALAPDDEPLASARAALAAERPTQEAAPPRGPEAAPATVSVAPAEPESTAAVQPEPDPAVAAQPEPDPPAAVESVAVEPVRDRVSVAPSQSAPPEPAARPRATAAAAAAAANAAAAAAAAEMAALDAMRAALVPEDERATAEAASAELAAQSSEGEPGEGGAWPAIDLPSRPPEPLIGPPPDATDLQADAEALIDDGDDLAAGDLLLLAVTVHRAAGRLDAALDSALQLLAIAPGDPRVHLAIANLQLDRGWRAVATEKIELLLRLTSLAGDVQAEADVHLLAAERLRDESPARLDARRRGIAAS
jgi:tetratricopeptide (TPR) repeat protein